MTVSASIDIVALGEALIEFNQTRGSESAQYLQGFGGDTSNCIIAAARQGARAGYMTRLGDDAFGRLLIDLWREEHVETCGVKVDADAPTGVYFVTHGEHGHEFSYLRLGSAASRMRPQDLDLELIRGAKILHVSGISQAISASACDTVFAAIEEARAARVQVAYDPNLRLKLWPLARAKSIVSSTIALCDYCLPGSDDIRLLSGTSLIDEMLSWCARRGAPCTILKHGAEGVWISTASASLHVAAHAVSAVDATGAGDCFDGAFCARIVAGDQVIDAARYANAAAALATTGYGAVGPLPRREAVEAFLASVCSIGVNRP